MTYTPAELSGLLDEAEEMPPGEAQVDAVREVVRHAEAAGLLDIEIEARLMLVQALMQAAQNEEDVNDVLTAFTRCVGLYTAHPDRFDEETLDVLWGQFAVQGMALSLMTNYPLRLVRGVFDDMERRCRPDRDDLHTVHSMRLVLAEATGDTAMGDRALETLRHRDPAGYACPACLVAYQVRYLANAGRYAEAVAVGQPIVTGEIPCDTGAQPAGVLAILQLCLLRLGELEEARDAHRTAYRGLDHDDEFDVAQHVRFCVLTGNTDRALEIFRRHMRLVEGTPSILNQLELWAASALMFRVLAEAGRGEEVLVWPADPDVPGDEEEEWTFADLYEELLKEAEELASAYDRRNGTTRISERMRAVVHEAPVVEELPLSPVAVRRSEIAAAQASPAAAPCSPPSLSAPFDPTAPDPAFPEIAEAVKPVPAEDPMRVALAHARRGEDLLNSGDAEAAIGEFIEAAARFTMLGDSRLACFARVDLADAYLRVGRHLDAAECAEEALPDVPPDGDAAYVGLQARWVLACAYPELGQPEDALRMLDEMAERATGPATLGRVAQKAGELLSELEREEEAAGRFTEAAARFAEAGDRFEEAVCLRQAAVSHSWSGDPHEALSFADRAAAAVGRLPDGEERSVWELGALQFDRARILARHDRFEEAAREAERAAETLRGTADRAFVTHSEVMAGRLWYRLDETAAAEAAARRALAESPQNEEHEGDLEEARELLARL